MVVMQNYLRTTTLTSLFRITGRGGMASSAFIYRIHLLIWPLTLQPHCSVMNSRIVSFRTLDSESNSQMAALMAKETVSNPSRLLT